MTHSFVTGGAGFIGSHLIDRLLADGGAVTAYDNLVSGTEANLGQALANERFRFVRGDLLNSEKLQSAMSGCDVVWHLGANTDIPGGNRVTDLDLKNCTVSTRNVLEAMRANGIDRMAFASSACVYGDAPPQRLAESFGPLHPINLYGAGKLACEGLISAYCHLFGMRAWMFRFANVVGARMSHGVIFDFIRKLRDDPMVLEILGDGNQEKPYFLVEDCIEGMLCAFRNSNGQYDVFNLGCESSTKVTQIARIVGQEMGLTDVRFAYAGGRRGWAGDVPVIHFNIEKMKALGWRPRYSSDEAVREAARRLLSEEG